MSFEHDGPEEVLGDGDHQGGLGDGDHQDIYGDGDLCVKGHTASQFI